jgi:acetyl-CoA decarbonylase/synthase complex subunit delta
MLAQPIICDIGIEAWGVKEARVSEAEIPDWGPQRRRAPLWEASTALACLLAGGDLFVLRHPEAVQSLKKSIAELAGANITAVAA